MKISISSVICLPIYISIPSIDSLKTVINYQTDFRLSPQMQTCRSCEPVFLNIAEYRPRREVDGDMEKLSS